MVSIRTGNFSPRPGKMFRKWVQALPRGSFRKKAYILPCILSSANNPVNLP
jgi:hypothetical protein